MRVAVNISGYQLRQDDLVDHLCGCLRGTASRRALHLRDHRDGGDGGHARHARRLRAAAPRRRARVDRRLRHRPLQPGLAAPLPAAELKIDRAFVTDLETSDDARSIAAAMVRWRTCWTCAWWPKAWRPRTQRDWLVEIGCDELQGYLFAKPMSATALGIWASGEHGPSAVGFRDSLFKETAPQSISAR
jgi:hypothetical protein